MQAIQISSPPRPIRSQIVLPSSKSESNRALILQALALLQSGNRIKLDNLSNARDTQTMIRLLESPASLDTWDVLDAGTTMRFLTAFAAISNQEKILTGTERMKQRPIGPLVDALMSLGFQIEYLGNSGYPPLKIHPIADMSQLASQTQIRGDISSQFISALLMIAPLLPQGLVLELTGTIFSRPYIRMTLHLMELFGVQSDWKGARIQIAPQKYRGGTYTIESDWSAASYWFSMASLMPGSQISLPGLRVNSWQGDSQIVPLMQALDVRTEFESKQIIVEYEDSRDHSDLQIDFQTCPDLAQTIITACAAKSRTLKAQGLESLKIKETNRVLALQNELKKLGWQLDEQGKTWTLEAQKEVPTPSEQGIRIETYEDHRMAMAFAPLGLHFNLIIEDPKVVNKSYPHFWQDLEKVGFSLKEVT